MSGIKRALKRNAQKLLKAHYKASNKASLANFAKLRDREILARTQSVAAESLELEKESTQDGNS